MRRAQGSGLEIVGYAAVFNRPDAGGDVIRPGAFARSLARRPHADIALLWQHEPARPIGGWLSLAEDALGLRVRGRLVEGVQGAGEAAHLLAAGALSGLSIGFRAVRAERPHRLSHQAKTPGQASVTRILTEIDLWEVSLVTFPQMPLARARLVPAAPGRAKV